MPIHTELLFVFHLEPLESRRQLEVTSIEMPGFSRATWQIVNYDKSERKLLYWFASGEQLLSRIQRGWAWISLILIENCLCCPGCSMECFVSLVTILPLAPCCMYLLCIIGIGVTQPWATVPSPRVADSLWYGTAAWLAIALLGELQEFSKGSRGWPFEKRKGERREAHKREVIDLEQR